MKLPGINLAYSASNRSASIRPTVSPFVLREEPEGAPNRSALSRSDRDPYLAFSAMLLAGLDGVQEREKIHPGDPIDKNLYDLPPEEAKKVPNVCSSPRAGAGNAQ